MEKLKQLKLQSAVALLEKEMKAVRGGSCGTSGCEGDDCGYSGYNGGSFGSGSHDGFACNLSYRGSYMGTISCVGLTRRYCEEDCERDNPGLRCDCD